MYPNATTKGRQTYLGMVTAMDDFVGTLVASLKKQGIYEDTIIVFSSDNGGLVDAGGASNLPLKGQKSTLYEGGVRVPGFVHSPNFVKNPGRTHSKLVRKVHTLKFYERSRLMSISISTLILFYN